jgi:hypothetical protein
MRVYHQTPGFRPIVDLYDGDTFVEEVTANYVVYEVTGRSDFTYNATVKQVGCQSRPVSWSEIDNKGLSEWEWSPEYMRDCFESNSEEPVMNGNLEYEVMNSSGISYIKFPVDGNEGLFYFKIQIVDPEYSYCTLRGRFALQVYGAPLSNLWIVLIVMICCVVIIAGLLLTYFVRFKELRGEKED